MTDTTDTASLKKQIETAADIIRDLTDKLEAERQRADELKSFYDQEQKLAGRFLRERDCARQVVDELQAELAALKPEINWPVSQKVRAALDRAACPDAFMRIAVEACTEALKGDQAHMEDADYTRYSCGCCGFESLHHTTKCPECNYHKIESEPLFTAPQKPGVHPDTKRMDWLCAQVVEVREPMFYGSRAMFWSQCNSDDCEEYHTTLREQVDAAIEAAGGIVKDGE
ncbi:hypothetical protein J1779_15060 [Rahnella sp. FC061912-K]|uniref:hypothetical protein n=1 Tax=Rahnella rivi TaxID=2816249 RepID=UPI001C261D63|nr:hypothetical protein [Rahnella rivi]MBU9831255.1 hypothetical protein [Rahnella rivi]